VKVVPLYLYGQFITLMKRQVIVQNHPWTLDLVTAMTTAVMIDNYLQTTICSPLPETEGHQWQNWSTYKCKKSFL
jgi:hypothetical protein